jgi:hypothetical protein
MSKLREMDIVFGLTLFEFSHCIQKPVNYDH